MLLVATLCVGVSAQRWPDPTFGSQGLVVTDFGGTDTPVRLLPDQGSYFVVANRQVNGGNEIRVAKYDSSGSLDPLYGSNGIAIGPADSAADAVLDGNGGIVVALGGYNANVRLIRFTASGGIDSGFGTGGIASVSTGSGYGAAPACIVIQPTGNLVVACKHQAGLFFSYFGLARFLPNGTPDNAFGTAGFLDVTGFGYDTYAAAGSNHPGGGMVFAGIGPAGLTGSCMFVGMVGADGSFGWRQCISFGGTYDRAFAVALQSNGKILAGGNAQNIPSNALARLAPANGAVDTSFGTQGLVTTPGAPSIGRIVVEPDDGILVTGNGGFGVLRYLPDGQLDPSWGNQNTISVALPVATFDFVETSNGDIVVTGKMPSPAGADVALLRYTTSPPLPPTIYGCGANPAGSLTVTGTAKLGASVTVGVDNPLGTQAAGSLPAVVVSRSPQPNYPCGALIPGYGMRGSGATGELLIDVSGVVFLTAPPWAGPGMPSTVSLGIPTSVSLLGGTVYVQGALLDAVAAQGVAVGLTEGAKMTLGL